MFRPAVLLLMFGLVPTLPASAQGGLLVTPQRVVFEGATRTRSVTVFNRSTTRAVYRLFFEEKRMTEDGLLETVPAEAAPHSAAAWVRVAPRRIELAPGGTQKIRLMLRRPPGAEAGEYRSHLVFQIAPETGTHGLQTPQTSPGEVGVRLTPLFGASIPVIVRQGNLQAAIRIEAADVREGTPAMPEALTLHFHREGDRSVYGDIRVSFMPDAGDPVALGHVRGMAVYTDRRTRTLTLPLRWPDGVSPRGGDLSITFTENDQAAGTRAEHRVPLQ